MRNIIFYIVCCCFIGCVSNVNVVSVRQIKDTNPIVLRIGEDKSKIFSLKYPYLLSLKRMIKERYIILNPLTLLNMMNYVLELANVG